VPGEASGSGDGLKRSAILEEDDGYDEICDAPPCHEPRGINEAIEMAKGFSNVVLSAGYLEYPARGDGKKYPTQ
jgi:hypothetical protein